MQVRTPNSTRALCQRRAATPPNTRVHLQLACTPRCPWSEWQPPGPPLSAASRQVPSNAVRIQFDCSLNFRYSVSARPATISACVSGNDVARGSIGAVITYQNVRRAEGSMQYPQPTHVEVQRWVRGLRVCGWGARGGREPAAVYDVLAPVQAGGFLIVSITGAAVCWQLELVAAC